AEDGIRDFHVTGVQTCALPISDGDLEALRLFSAVIGFGVVVCVWLIGRKLFPDKPWLGLTAAAFIAFLPQRLAMMSGVNNDSLRSEERRVGKESRCREMLCHRK